MRETKKKGFLKNIRPHGVAGVDHPAHEHEGWAVIKAAKEVSMDTELETQLEEILQLAEKFSNDHTSLMKALVDAEEYLEDAPNEVKDAAVTLYKHLHAVETAEDADAASDEGTEEVAEELTAQNVESAVATAKEKKPSLLARIFAGIAAQRVEPTPAPDTGEETVTQKSVEATEVESTEWEGFITEVTTLVSKEIRKEEV